MRKFLLAYTMLAALGAPAMAGPFVSGSEPNWGKHMSAKQLRMLGEDDVRTALQTNHQPAPVVSGVKGFAFKLLTFRHEGQGPSGSARGGVGASLGGNEGNRNTIPPPSSPPQMNPIQSKFFGVFKNIQECDVARAQKIAELDDRNERFWHQRADAPTITTYYGSGMASTQQIALKERKDVTFCEPGEYSPGEPSQLSPNIATKDSETTGAATPIAQTTRLEVPPGFVKHWVAPRPFTRVVPGTSEVVEILSAKDRELVFMVKPDVGGIISSETTTAFGTTTTSTAALIATNILLLEDNGEVVANLRISIPEPLDHEIRQGRDGSQSYRKDNPDHVPPKVKK